METGSFESVLCEMSKKYIYDSTVHILFKMLYVIQKGGNYMNHKLVEHKSAVSVI